MLDGENKSRGQVPERLLYDTVDEDLKGSDRSIVRDDTFVGGSSVFGRCHDHVVEALLHLLNRRDRVTLQS